jgi:RNA polymerase sigma-70 factor (ECF subfamily)
MPSETTAVPPGDGPTVPDLLSWEWIARDRAKTIYRIAYGLTGNRPDAEDVAQDALVRVFRYVSAFTPGLGSFDGWLYRITKNAYLDRLRKAQRGRVTRDESVLERVAGAEPDPADSYEARTLDADVRAALAALQPNFRAAVVLCDLEGLSRRQVAELLNIKAATVGTRLFRGRTQLRAALAHRGPGAGA